MGGANIPFRALKAADSFVSIQDPAQAEALIGSSTMRGTHTQMITALPRDGDVGEGSNSMAVDEPAPSALVHVHTGVQPSIGTPLRMAPATSAFRASNSAKSTPVRQAAPPAPPSTPATGILSHSPQKGVLGQVSDLIFGW